MTQRRLTPDERRKVILDAAIELTKQNDGDVLSWTREDLAKACAVPTAVDTIKHYYTQPELRELVRAATQ